MVFPFFSPSPLLYSLFPALQPEWSFSGTTMTTGLPYPLIVLQCPQDKIQICIDFVFKTFNDQAHARHLQLCVLLHFKPSSPVIFFESFPKTCVLANIPFRSLRSRVSSGSVRLVAYLLGCQLKTQTTWFSIYPPLELLSASPELPLCFICLFPWKPFIIGSSVLLSPLLGWEILEGRAVCLLS